MLLLSVLWQVDECYGCLSGRYGRYDNWPSTSDWEELLILLTGKYGKNGWGWQSENSYAYNSVGDYPFGTLKYSSSPWGASGSSGSSGLFSSSHSTSSSSGGSSYNAASSKLRTEKIKEALNNYFKSKPSTSSGWGSSSGGEGGFVGESFIDSPRPGPPYDDSPPGPGPPYSSISHDNSVNDPLPFPPTIEGPSWSDGGSSSGPPGNLEPFNNGPPSSENNHQSSWPLPQGPSLSGPQDDHATYSGNHHNVDGQPFPHNNNHLFNSNEHHNGGNGNQFQSDFDTLGPPGKKRRRQGRRRSHNPQPEQSNYTQQSHRTSRQQRFNKAGLPTRPVGSTTSSRPYQFPTHPGGRRRGRYSRKSRRMGLPLSVLKRKLDTSFGGYKVDHSRLRFG